MFKIKSFGYHLSTYQYIYFPAFKCINDLLISMLTSRSVKVHTLDFYIRNEDREFFFDLLSPYAYGLDFIRLTFFAFRIKKYFISTIMANDFILINMIGKTDGAVGTVRNVIAVITFYIWRVTPSVLKENYLFVFGYTGFDLVKQC